MTTIFELREKGGGVKRIASYSTPPKRSMVNYIMQYIHNNFNTWEYPDIIKGMREVRGNWYFDDIKGKRVIAAYEY